MNNTYQPNIQTQTSLQFQNHFIPQIQSNPSNCSNYSQNSSQSDNNKTFCSQNIFAYFSQFQKLFKKNEHIQSKKIAQISHIHHQVDITQIDFKDIQNYIKKVLSTQKKRNWGKYDTIILIWVIQKYSILKKKHHSQFTQQNWRQISQLVPWKNTQQCMFKWLNITNCVDKKKQPWTIQQDKFLPLIISQFINQKYIKWYEVSQNLYKSNINPGVYRTGKQCRQRWICFLNPNNKKGHWNVKQDIILLQKYLQFGNKWSHISRYYLKRTQNAVKNRFKLIMNKKNDKKYKNVNMNDDEFMRLKLGQLKEQEQRQLEKGEQELQMIEIKQIKDKVCIQLTSIESNNQWNKQQQSRLVLRFNDEDYQLHDNRIWNNLEQSIFDYI